MLFSGKHLESKKTSYFVVTESKDSKTAMNHAYLRYFGRKWYRIMHPMSSPNYACLCLLLYTTYSSKTKYLIKKNDYPDCDIVAPVTFTCSLCYNQRYRKIPVISPGLIQLRKGFWVGL